MVSFFSIFYCCPGTVVSICPPNPPPCCAQVSFFELTDRGKKEHTFLKKQTNFFLTNLLYNQVFVIKIRVWNVICMNFREKSNQNK